MEAGAWSLEVRGWRLEGKRLKLGDWRLDWRLEAEVLDFWMANICKNC